MMEPMFPSLEGGQPDTAINGRPTAGTGRPLSSESPKEEVDIDELIINSSKVPLLQDNIDRIEKNFNVEVKMGFSAMEHVEMQWITIQGLAEDRALAKSYIKALCSPGKDLKFNFPDELHQTLTYPAILDHLERQSNTAILFPSLGHAIIQGEDDLAVTLAMSAIEDIIQKYGDADIPDASSPNSSIGEVTERLDRELRRLSSQNKELYADDYDMENLTSLSGAVKRTLLKQYMDDRQCSVDEQPKGDLNTTYSRDPEQTVPMTIVGSTGGSRVSTFSEKPFVDLHPAKHPSGNDTLQQQPRTEIELHSPASSSHNDSSISLSLRLNDKFDAANFIDLRKSVIPTTISGNRMGPPNASVCLISSNPPVMSPPTVDLTQPDPIPAESADPTDLIYEAINFALTSGYSNQEIKEVQRAYGNLLTTAEFLRALHTNRREKTQKHAVTVTDLEATHMPRPPQDGNAEVREISEAVTDNSQLEEEPERPLTPSGKQQSHKGHNQGPKMKKGKLSKTPVKQAGKKSQARRNRRSPSDENTEKMEIVSLIDGVNADVPKVVSSPPNTMRDLLQNKLHSSVKMKPGLKETTKNSGPLTDYLKQLSQDFDEEDSSDIEEMRKRNSERRKLLVQVLEQQSEKHKSDADVSKLEEDDGDCVVIEEDVIEELEGEDWTTASRDGRHRFQRLSEGSPGKETPLRVAGGGSPAGSGVKTKKPDVSIPSTSNDIRPKPLDRDGASSIHGMPQALGPIDALDDFSLPYMGNSDHADGGVKPFPRQHDARSNNSSTQQKQLRFSNPSDHRNPAYKQVQPPQQYNQQPQPYPPVPQPLMSKQQQPLILQYPVLTNSTYTCDNGSKLASKSNLRYIVLDGSSIAMAHGNHQIYSCKGIKICIDFFRRRGHTEITAFVPQWRTRMPRPEYPMRDQHMLEELRKEGVLVFTPARRVPGKNIVCYDDKFVLRLAQETDGVIVSNDNYRDLWHEKREWRQIIEERLLMFSFVGDIFMAPDDPLGRDGPKLDDFLRKCNFLPDWGNQQQSRQQHGNDSHLYNRHSKSQGSWAIWDRQAQGQFNGRPIHGQGVRNPNPAASYDYGDGYSGPTPSKQGQGHFLHNPQRQSQGHYPQNPRTPGQGQGHLNQNASSGPRPRVDDETKWLKTTLLGIFPNKEAQIDEVLQRHPTETNINKLIAEKELLGDE